MKLDKEQKRLMKALEKHGFSVEFDDKEIEIENWTDGGEDMLIYLDDFSVEELELYADDYDIDEHIEMMMQDKRPGGYAANFTLTEALADQTAWLEDLREVIREAKGLPKPQKKTRKTSAKLTLYLVTEHDEAFTNPGVLMGLYHSEKEAIDAVMKHGRFDHDTNADYIREQLKENGQTPLTSPCNYQITQAKTGSWEEIL